MPFDDFDLFETCEEYYDDAAEFEAKYAEDDDDDYYYDAFVDDEFQLIM